MRQARALWDAYKLRLKRKRFLWRAFRSRHRLTALANNTARIGPKSILAFVTLRNEALRLPHFLEYYRALGVDHFLVVDNGSSDGSLALLRAPDISLWQTQASYRAARFGLDWLTWLMMRYGRGRWCLTLDVDELLIYPHHETRSLRALTGFLEQCGQQSMPAMMLDLYPKGPLDQAPYRAGEDPLAVLNWFDSGNYTITHQPQIDALWIQGGPRARAFFAQNPRQAPTLSKLPLVKWSPRYVYLNSTHALLPRRLNRVYDTQGEAISGLLLHTKFLHSIVEKSAEEKQRREHFGRPEEFDGYYDALLQAPDLWTPHSTALTDWRGFEARGLLSRGGWV